jgi:tyrosyl-tRNA synthetase
MGGDLKKIQTVGKYMIEVWKAAGMDLSRVEFIYSSEEINSRCVLDVVVVACLF